MDRKEILEAAFDKAESGDDDTAVLEQGATDAPLEEADKGSEGSGEPEQKVTPDKALADGKGGKKPEEISSGAVGAKAKEAQQKAPPKDEALGRAAQAAAGGADGTKAPVSWKPAAKEQWAKLPVDIRQEVLRRETEISKYISQNDHHRKFGESFTQIVKPFYPLIQAQNSTPLQAVKNMMTTAAGLAVGNPGQKAQIVAEIIGNYNIDIEMLDKLLSGQTNPQHQQSRGQGSIDPAMLQALQPVFGFMDEVKQARTQREQRQVQEAHALIEDKSTTLPFFEDLTDDMADLMEIASKRGIELTLEQAHEKALALNPEISKIVATQRATEEARKNGGTRLSQRRRAASTISGGPSGGGDGKTVPKNRKEALEAAWDEAGQ